MIKYLQGNLIEYAKNGKFDIIAHGCNCFHTMGAGIALQIRKEWPIVYEYDCKYTLRGDKDKLGTNWPVLVKSDLVVLNCYTQYKYGRDKQYADYDAIRSCMKDIKQSWHGFRIGMPKIGCNLAGGDWNIVSKIIEEELEDEDVTIMYL